VPVRASSSGEQRTRDMFFALVRQHLASLYHVVAALAGMPRQRRRALMVRHVQGLTGASLAGALGPPEPAAERIIASAREYLRQRLIDSGWGASKERGATSDATKI
jgi:DNA-directed RNA polymerase specialized sigma24 family protein